MTYKKIFSQTEKRQGIIIAILAVVMYYLMRKEGIIVLFFTVLGFFIFGPAGGLVGVILGITLAAEAKSQKKKR